MRQAKVFYKTQEAGIITQLDDGSFVFTYLASWVHDGSKPPISLTLPKTEREYTSQNLFPFFFNMLSEGTNRMVQSKQLKIDEKDYFGLLLATASFDTIGAITIKQLK